MLWYGLQNQTWKKMIFFTHARFHKNYFTPKKGVNCDKSEFATKQRKMYLTTSMSKIRLPLLEARCMQEFKFVPFLSVKVTKIPI